MPRDCKHYSGSVLLLVFAREGVFAFGAVFGLVGGRLVVVGAALGPWR